ncbi:MAG: hypothetical protein A3D94_14375 [Alphaproteobacteria bacterium RIFCSPHIGHO2_12_FULL_66_14]|nr:MAG: hypothetical protein A3D94_14375 [Alphaproteobacteria bacterium RIFCSPHIGHO2_12_FULL_66_14]
METFLWDKHFTTGLETVDDQHHKLVDLINRLGDSFIASNVSDDGLTAIFTELADYAQYHFADEERLMLESGIDTRHRETHHRHHVEFVDQIGALWNARNSIHNAAETLHGFLCAWLASHILGEDQSMARQIERVRAGEHPATAYDREATTRDNPTEALLSALHTLHHVLAEQNRELVTANSLLEKRVSERTEKLSRANQELTDLNRRLDALSNRDGLLGIANRRHFDSALDIEWRRSSRDKSPLSLLMIDVDHFKQYNDRYGHQAGDSCLQKIARAALAELKREGDLLARYGGEEIAALLPNTPAEGALLIAERLRKAIADLLIPHAGSPVAGHVTVSIGVATRIPTSSTSPNLLIGAADRGLYHAKQTGRDRVQLEESEAPEDAPAPPG